MTTVKEQDAKQRILAAATELFSQKGFDATGVSEIAKEAQVNKALIYYYFENKEAILDSLIDAMLSNVSTLTLKFARECLGPMIQAGTLRLEDERFLFADEQALESFSAELHRYYKEIVDYTLDRRAIVRILMYESLKGGKHQTSLFRLMELLEKRPGNSNELPEGAVSQADSYREDTVFYEFFFSIIPLVSIAAYFDEYQAKSELSDQRLRELALQSYLAHAKSIHADRFIVLES
ncbi:MAG: TetR family transcriptional regulator [Bacillota bacterium]|nr:TetR family transcriptional regulator [Bacillota bacterium]